MVALIYIQQQSKKQFAKEWEVFFKNMEKFKPIGPDVAVDLPLMGTIEVEVFSCSNIQNFRTSDRY